MVAQLPASNLIELHTVSKGWIFGEVSARILGTKSGYGGFISKTDPSRPSGSFMLENVIIGCKM